MNPPLSVLYGLTKRICGTLDNPRALRVIRMALGTMVRPFRHLRINALQRFFGSAGLTKADCAKIDGNYLDFQARLVLENIRLLTIPPDELQGKIVLDGENHLKDALAGQRGVLLVCTHIGNWLLAPAFLASLGYRVSAIAYEIPIRSIEQHMQQIWARYGITIAHAGKESVRAAKRALDRNEALVMAFDASVRPSENQWMPFGDIAIAADPGPARLASILRAPMLRLHTRPINDEKTSLSLSPLPRGDGDLMESWLAGLHDEVSANPELWWPWSFVRLGPATLISRNHPMVTRQSMPTI